MTILEIRLERYDKIRRAQLLHEQGIRIIDIAAELLVSPDTVRHYLRKNLIDEFFKINPGVKEAMPVDSNTPKWQILREAANRLEDAENLLELTNLKELQHLARDIRTLEVEILREAIDAKETSPEV